MSTAVDNTLPPNPAPTQPAKNARKRRNRKDKTTSGESVNGTIATSTDASGSGQRTTALDSPTEPGEPVHVKNLQKALRNANKKLNATAKVDAILAENPGKSLDELVDSKIINADQKAQILKKPALQESVKSIEEQITQFEDYIKFYDAKREKQLLDLDALKAAHQAELTAQVATAREEAAASAREEAEKNFSERLLTFSRFLAAVAHRRTKEDLTTPISQAFEAVLVQVFHGTETAVSDANKLITGSQDKVHTISGESLDVTYAEVKELSIKQVLETTSAAQGPEESTPTQEPDTSAGPGQSNHLEQADPSVIAASADAQVSSEHDQSRPNAELLATSLEQSSFALNSHVNGYSDVNYAGPIEPQEQPVKPSAPIETAPVEQPVLGENVKTEVPKDAPSSAAPLAGSEIPQSEQPTVENGIPSDSTPRSGSNSFSGRGRGRGRGFRGRGGFRGGGRGRGRGGMHHQQRNNFAPRNHPQEQHQDWLPQSAEATTAQQW